MIDTRKPSSNTKPHAQKKISSSTPDRSVLEDTADYNWHRPTVDNYDRLDLKAELLQNIHAHNYSPSELQGRALEPLMHGRDLIARVIPNDDVYTALAIVIVQRLDPAIKFVQALVVVPDSHVARKIQELVAALGNFTNVNCQILVAGADVHDDFAKLENDDAQVIVGTPGRVYQMITRKALRTDNIRMLYLCGAGSSEARQLKRNIFDVHRRVVQEKRAGVVQVVLCADRLPADMVEKIGMLLRNPVRVVVPE
ncbi:unnamed protein product [Peniophora sp. CBMAI 1063]|nr:unnamed protein product [Peniophora sp. CBMAI 1063]